MFRMPPVCNCTDPVIALQLPPPLVVGRVSWWNFTTCGKRLPGRKGTDLVTWPGTGATASDASRAEKEQIRPPRMSRVGAVLTAHARRRSSGDCLGVWVVLLGSWGDFGVGPRPHNVFCWLWNVVACPTISAIYSSFAIRVR